MYVPGTEFALDGPLPPFTIDFVIAYPIAPAPAPKGACSQGIPANMVVGMAAVPGGRGYWLAGQNGQVAACGDAPVLGNAITPTPVVAITAAPNGIGYWLVTTNGMVYAFGSAKWYGQPVVLDTSANPYGIMLSHVIAQPIVGMAADPKTGGYWLIDRNGNVYNYNAPKKASIAGQTSAGIAAFPEGTGYWVVTKTGAVLNLGGAKRYGSLTEAELGRSTVTGITADQATGGYWVLLSSGHVLGFHATTFGAAGGLAVPAVGLSALGNGKGYRVVRANGRIIDFGAAAHEGSAN
jgi:hypothetical protein